MYKVCFYLAVLMLTFIQPGAGQPQNFNFHKLGIAEGLHDGTARCIGQDKYGYIWIGTVGALNRFDGKNIEHYLKRPGDKNSPYGSQPRCIYSDPNGRLWIGFESGMMEFDFETRSFKEVPALKDFFVQRIQGINDSIFFVATRRGLVKLNIVSGQAFEYSKSLQPDHSILGKFAINDMEGRKNLLYVASDGGLAILDVLSNQATAIQLPQLTDRAVFTLALDSQENIWLGTQTELKLMRLSKDLKTLEIYDKFLTSNINTHSLNMMEIMVDNKNRVWVVTAIDGILQFMEKENKFVKHLHNYFLPSSPSGNQYRCIYQDRQGIIWLGCDFSGVNFFHPDQFSFRIIFPQPDHLDERARVVARAITEDKSGNLWMGNHDGVARYNPKTGAYTTWRNTEGQPGVVYSNGVRSIYCDEENNIWIGTTAGVNKFVSLTGKMEFIDKTKLPLAFYNSINGDRSGNVWFCCNSRESLHWYSLKEKKYYGILEHPQLKRFAGVTSTSLVLEDSRNRLWISYSRKGVVMLDKRSGLVHQYLASDTLNKGIIGNQVVDIKEDKYGMIWISSFNGITGIDADKNRFLSFNIDNGLPGNWCSPLAIDDQNRVWAGVSGGLCMLSSDRKKIRRFSFADGLPSIGFPEHAGFVSRSGIIYLPTYNGFISFKPDEYHDKVQQLSSFVASYSVFEKKYPLPYSGSNGQSISLKTNETSFSFDLTCLNYLSPDETWFAYKLDGFEQNWHVTRNPKAVYTNVPGGHFKFLYKAALTNGNWDEIKADGLSVYLPVVFYKSPWFLASVILVVALGSYVFYRYRIQQHRQMFELRTKTSLLEREKATIQYDSLKQQLNPHFLFNSLTSLYGLIHVDQDVAADFLDKMSTIYRYILKNGDKETISLQEELEFVQLYIDLQKTRFGKGLIVNINVPEEYIYFKIAPVTLQNMIENALKHNIIDRDSPLIIDLYVEDDYLCIRNNLQKKAMVETSNKQGLTQLKKLYQFLSHKPIHIVETENSFMIKIPLI